MCSSSRDPFNYQTGLTCSKMVLQTFDYEIMDNWLEVEVLRKYLHTKLDLFVLPCDYFRSLHGFTYTCYFHKNKWFKPGNICKYRLHSKVVKFNFVIRYRPTYTQPATVIRPISFRPTDESNSETILTYILIFLISIE